MARVRPREHRISRRSFVTGVVAGGIVGGLGWSRAARGNPFNVAPTLRGTEFDLEIADRPVDFTGAVRRATVVNGSLPAPILRWRQGDTVTLRVSNRLPFSSSIHWHGIILPAAMDGVPGLSFHGIEPGGSYLYRFDVEQNGTYWYHAHSAFQEQTGLYGPLVIDPREPEPFAFDREHVVMLSDWTDMAADRVFAVLKKRADYFNYHQRTVGDFLRDVQEKGAKAAWADRLAWGEMRMTPTDLADVTGATYTYLMNGNAPAANWTGLFAPGERVRLRFINGSAMSIFDVRIPGLAMTVVAADGQYVHPVTVDEFRISVAETFDVIVTPTDAPYTIFAQSIDRTGFARGTLAPRPGMEGPVPALDRRPLLTMADMGHGGHAGHASSSPATDPHAGHTTSATVADAHASHGAPAPSPHAGHLSEPADPHAAHRAAGAPTSSIVEVQHPSAESGPAVDMQAMSPRSGLDDPGIGLRDDDLHRLRAGHRKSHSVLTMSALRSLFEDPDGRDPMRTIQLHLTGHMERYIFSFDGVKFSDAQPIKLRYGERVRIVLVNDTMMEHPIHLHGMWSDLEDESGNFHVRKHTISVPPGSLRSYRVTADALGRWAYHCHLLYHMEAGMFRAVHVS
jgi:CopA family copper-resistance protein